MKKLGVAEKNLDRTLGMSFAFVYPLYLARLEKHGRTRQELNQVIRWLTGYSPQALSGHLKRETTIEAFYEEAPEIHPNAHKITGTVCGYRVQDIEHAVMRRSRMLEKLVDELARGRPMEKILRT